MGFVPLLHRYYGALRLLASRLGSLRFLHEPIPPLALLVLFRARKHLLKRFNAQPLAAWSYSFRYPHRYIRVGENKISQVPG